MYNFSRNILSYKIKNNIDVKEYLKELDPLSQDLIKRVLERIITIYTHSLIILKELLTPEELALEENIKNHLSLIQNIVKFPINRYEISIFYYDCGLKLLPKDVVYGIQNKDIIDAGAFFGDSAFMFERNYHPNKIYAFEPESKNYKLLLKTIKQNNLGKVIPVNKAVGEHKSILRITGTGGSSKISESRGLKIEIISIDEFALKNDLNIGLIKMDIEGFALKALRGTKETIKAFSPILLISIYHNGEEFFEIMNYIKKLNPNYKFLIRKLNPLNPILEVTLIGWID